MQEEEGRITRSLKKVKNGAGKVTGMVHRDRAWEGLNTLPSGSAGLTVTPGCLVLEGGSFRGMYTSGVLDVFMEKGLNFATTVGTSAGALNGLNYTAGEIGRAARINLTYRHDSRYFGVPAVANGRCMLGLKFIVEDLVREIPLDFDRLNDPERGLVVTATDCETGECIYFEKGRCVEFLKAVRASASLPYLSKMVNMEGHLCLDGGVSVKIPYEWALSREFKNIVVIRTRPQDFRRQPENGQKTDGAQMFYKDYPRIVEKLNSQAEAYNAQCDALDTLHREGRVYMLCPSEPINLGTLEGDMDKLAYVYNLGRRDALSRYDEIIEYLHGRNGG